MKREAPSEEITQAEPLDATRGSGYRRRATHRLLPGALLAAAALLLAAAVPAALASPSEWSVLPSPNLGGGSNTLNAVSCLTGVDCAAVGSAIGAYGAEPLAESWDGSEWSLVPLSFPTEYTGSLGGVSCVSSTFCVAAGSYNHFAMGPIPAQTLVETWNGSEWSITPSPNEGIAKSNVLAAVSCASASFCVAVGNHQPSFGGPAQLIEVWNGEKWSIATPPSTPGSVTYLSGVSCFSASYCAAVGRYEASGRFYTLTESWNGSKWSTLPSENRAEAESNLLGSVSCSAVRRCSAAGSAEGTLVETLHHGEWTIQATPNPEGSGSSALTGISCTSPKACAAVGAYSEGETSRTLVEGFSHHVWSLIPSANGEGAASALEGVSCVTVPSAACIAVGRQQPVPTGPTRTLVETGGI